LVAGCAIAVNKEPAWRNTPMSATANADPTADGMPPSSDMNWRRFTAPVPPVLPTERIAHLGPAGGAALRDLDPAYETGTRLHGS
jgi:hypothetical protein